MKTYPHTVRIWQHAINSKQWRRHYLRWAQGCSPADTGTAEGARERMASQTAAGVDKPHESESRNTEREGASLGQGGHGYTPAQAERQRCAGFYHGDSYHWTAQTTSLPQTAKNGDNSDLTTSKVPAYACTAVRSSRPTHSVDLGSTCRCPPGEE